MVLAGAVLANRSVVRAPELAARTGRALSAALAAVLIAEVAVGALLHEATSDLQTAAATGSVRERARAIYRLSERDDGSAATPALLSRAVEDDPRLAAFVLGILRKGPEGKPGRERYLDREHSPEVTRYVELVFERARTPEQYEELLSGNASGR